MSLGEARGETRRWHRLVRLLSQADLDGLLVTSEANRRYLSGFTGSSGVVVLGGTVGEAWLVTDPRYAEQARGEVGEGWNVVEHGLDQAAWVAEVIRAAGIRRLGFEADHLTHSAYHRYEDLLSGLTLVPTVGMVEGLRAIKDAMELDTLRQAARISSQAWAEVEQAVRPGAAEEDLAFEVSRSLHRYGASNAFSPIVAGGKRSALPHATPSSYALCPGDVVQFDLGARYQGYCSDLSRVLFLPPRSPLLVRVWEAVQLAYSAALSVLRPGVTGGEVDRAARSVLEEAGWERYTLRGLGHGVGLEIHEAPRLVMGSAEVLLPGMVFTLEPGVYLPGVGGVRYEDTVLLAEDGVHILTRLQAGG